LAGYVFRKVSTSIAMLVLTSVAIFVLLRVIPGDPTVAKLGEARGIPPQAYQHLRHQLYLDRSLPVQYGHWIGGVIRGDFGESYFSGFPVTTLIGQRLPATIQLAIVSLFFAFLFAIPTTIYAEIRRRRLVGAGLSGFATVGVSTPPFLIGLALIWLFTIHWALLPSRGYTPFLADPVGSMKAVLLPAITLAIALAAPMIRVFRASLAEARESPFVRTAEGKGLDRSKVVRRHVVPNALIPLLTIGGITAASLLSGAVVVEYVFARQGIGTLMVDSVQQRDYAVVQAIVLLAATTYIVASLLVDILYGYVDPRLKPGGAAS
jgi:peptide/nickel transport system permease protein